MCSLNNEQNLKYFEHVILVHNKADNSTLYLKQKKITELVRKPRSSPRADDGSRSPAGAPELLLKQRLFPISQEKKKNNQ